MDESILLRSTSILISFSQMETLSVIMLILYYYAELKLKCGTSICRVIELL